jgi:hypothetical protein
VAQECHQHLDDRTPALLAHTQRAGHRRWDKRRIGEGRQFDEEDSIRKHLEQVSRGLQRQPRLAHPTGSRQGHQLDILPPQEGVNLTELPLSTKQRCRLVVQIVQVARKRYEGRKVSGEIRVHELVDPLRLEQIAQPMFAEISEFGAGGKRIPSQLLNRL